MKLDIWQDNRSGNVGCITGNIILSQFAKEKGLKKKEVVHEKGTIFSTPEHIIVGRICASDQYLQKDIAHFCNMSPSQTKSIKHDKKEPLYLFITVSKSLVHYWLVPGKIVDHVMRHLETKPSSPSCFLRITDKSGKFFLGSENITQFHRSIPIPRNLKQKQGQS